MTLFLMMLPIYLFGNLHCLGMCGPLVMLIGRHRYRYFYFLGRACSFALTGMLAGAAGHILNVVLSRYHIPALTSFIFGGLILFIGLGSFFNLKSNSLAWFSRKLAPIHQSLSLLILKDQPFATFLFGFFTVALPCGQTIIVFSACAMSGDIWVGFWNGMAFALLTSPSLLIAMKAHLLFQRFKKYYNTVIGILGIFIGILSICRGLADLGCIPHLVLNPQSPAMYHLVIF